MYASGSGVVWKVSRAFVVACGLVCASIVAVPAFAQAGNVVVNGGFEPPPAAGSYSTLRAGDTSIPGWSIGGHSVDLVGSFWVAAQGTQSLDLNGDRPGSISQTPIPTQTGRYRLSFKYSGHPDRGQNDPKMTVRFGPAAAPFAPTFEQEITFNGQSTKSNMGWVLFEKDVDATSAASRLDFVSTGKNNPYGIAIDDVRLDFVPGPPLSTPVLFRAEAGISSSLLKGRVDGAGGLAITLQIDTGTSCTGGVLGGASSAGSVTATADPNGYFEVVVPDLTGPKFVTAKVTAPTVTPISNCVVNSAANDVWPSALPLGAGSQLVTGDFIDIPGKSRWYRFNVAPGQVIRIVLSGLPADYDLAAFKDIRQAFLTQLVPQTTTQLHQLSAEFAPSVFSPSVFSPSVFSPSVFSPDAYAPSVFSPDQTSPSVFSPSVFSPSVFSPSVFSPSVFSPSVFSPSVFSPSVFSPSVFSPSVFSPSVFSPSVFSVDELAYAFSSAQTRSLIGVSATAGAANELVVVNSWNNDGEFYVRVAGRGPAYSTAQPFSLSITKEGEACNDLTYTSLSSVPGTRPAPTMTLRRSVILTDSTKFPAGEREALLGALRNLASRNPDVIGVVEDVSTHPRVGLLRAQAEAKWQCPFAMNLLAEEIKAIVDGYRDASDPERLKYVVIAGGDDVIPFFRYPDQSLLGQESGYVPPVAGNTPSEASLRRDYVLSQDAYGAGVQVSLRTSEFPVPGLAVGRLVETSAEIVGMIQAYIDQPVVAPTSSLVTGYDFLEDAALAVKAEFDAGMGAGAVSNALIAPNDISPQDPAAWTATQLGQALFSRKHDVVFLAGHFSANSALAADFSTSLLTTDLAASTTSFKNSIVLSAGCHSGYNLLDSAGIPLVTLGLDWAQAFAQKQATLVAGTGYQYGDTDFIEYSERLYRNFARQLRTGTGVIAIGEALVKAKREYLAGTPDLRGIHEKALLEATLFGLPMLGVNMSATGRLPAPTFGGVIAPAAVTTGPASQLGLKTFVLDVDPALTPKSTTLKVVPVDGTTKLGEWLEGPGGAVVSNPAEPILPLQIANVTPTDATLVLRGVGFVSGTYGDRTVVALTGAPTTELRGVHVPFVSPVFYPMRTWSVNRWGALAGTGDTSLLLTPVQHRALQIADGTSTQRAYTDLKLKLYYSSIPAGQLAGATLADAPTIAGVSAFDAPGGGVDVSALVVGDPKAAIYEVWITYTNGTGSWTSASLTQCTGTPLPAVCGTTSDSRVWKANVAASNFRFVVQAANGLGLVTLDDNYGAYYGIGGAGSTVTTTTIETSPGSAAFGTSPSLSARLTDASGPLVGKPVMFAIGSAAAIGTTNSTGLASVSLPAVAVPNSYQLVVSFAGDDVHMPSATSAPFIVTKAPTALAADAGSARVTLTASIGGATAQPLLQEAVRFVATGAVSKEVFVNTDYLGRAAFPHQGLPPGSYSVSASFGGNATYTSAAASFTLNLAAQTIKFNGQPIPATLTMPTDFPYNFTATSDSGAPVTVELLAGSEAYCTLTPTGGGSYSLTATGTPGTCTLKASADGTVVFAAVTVTAPIAIKATQTLTFSNPTTLEYDATVTLPSATNQGLALTWTVTGNCSVTGFTLRATLGTGTCQLTASNAGNASYAPFAQTFAEFPLTLKPQTITTLTASPASPQIGVNTTFTVNAIASSGLPVTVTVTPAGVCALSATPNVVTIVGAGTCQVQATQGGESKYTPASLTLPVTILRGSQTITFNALPHRTLAQSPFTVTATASSGLPVTFSTSTTAVCSVTTAGQVTLNANGTCTIDANQAGNGSYDPAPTVSRSFTVVDAGSFTRVDSMAQARSSHTATALCNGDVIVAAGLDAQGKSTATTERYRHGRTPAWDSAGNMPSKAAGHAAVLVGTTEANKADPCSSPANTRVVSFGGGNASTDIYNPATNSWGPGGGMNASRSYHTATRLLNGNVLIVGGSDNSNVALATTQIYDPATGVFTNGPSLAFPRERHTATLLPTGEVLIAGGRRRLSGNNYSNVPTAEIFDPTGTMVTTATLQDPRYAHGAVQAGAWTSDPNHAALVVGGTNGSSNLASVEIYRTDSDQWIAGGGSMTVARSFHTATPFGSTIVVAGGRGPNAGESALSSSEIYFGGSFLPGPTMQKARFGHTATPFTTGGVTRLLVVGGTDSVQANGKSIADAEAYQAAP